MSSTLLPWSKIQNLILDTWDRVMDYISNTNFFSQISLIVIIGVVSYYLARSFLPFFHSRLEKWQLKGRLRSFARTFLHLLWLILAMGLLTFSIYGFAGQKQPNQIMTITANLAAAWVIIRLSSSFVHQIFLARAITVVAWLVAALNILGLLPDTIQFLDRIAFEAGHLKISLLSILKGVTLFFVLMWGAFSLSGLIESRLRHVPQITPSMQVLLGKLSKILFLTVALVMGLNAVGIDLTAFAVFSGALGVGVGFGLQKVVSNFISGIILLLDKSVKPGDVIQIGDTYGWVTSLSARYVSIVTRDGTEYLIPNEDLITHQVINWSFSNNLVRLKIPIGISYKADVHKARELIFEAIRGTPRVLASPEPLCHLVGFGDSSVNLEARFWINDPQNGTINVRSDVLLKVWDLFHEHNIEIPFPQRDLHLKSVDVDQFQKIWNQEKEQPSPMPPQAPSF